MALRADMTSLPLTCSCLDFSLHGRGAPASRSSIPIPRARSREATFRLFRRPQADPEGNLATKILTNGVKTSQAFNTDGRLTSITQEHGATRLDKNTYIYDPAGNRTQADSKTYDYNALNELTDSSDGTSYTYDQSGRLTQKTKNANTTAYDYNPFDELTSVDDKSGTTAFTYDALGRRQDRTRSGATEQAHYADLTDIPAFDTDQGGQLTQGYTSANPSPSTTESLISNLLSSQVNLPNQSQIGQVMAANGPITPVEGLVGQRQIPGLLEQRAGDQTTYPLQDAHGDITANTDQTGTVTARRSYDPWGTQTSGTPQSFGYLGAYMRRSDPTTGLVQMGARQYDPGLGRFTSEDQVLGYPTLGQSWNRHSYVFNRPLVMYDLDGRFAMPFPSPIQLPTPSDIAGAIGDPFNSTVNTIDAANRTACADPTNPVTSPACALLYPHETRQAEPYRSIRGKDEAKFAKGCVLGAGPGYAKGPQLVGNLIRKGPAALAGCILSGYTNVKYNYVPNY